MSNLSDATAEQWYIRRSPTRDRVPTGLIEMLRGMDRCETVARFHNAMTDILLFFTSTRLSPFHNTSRFRLCFPTQPLYWLVLAHLLVSPLLIISGYAFCGVFAESFPTFNTFAWDRIAGH